jgi:hypothetical protein
MKHSKYTGYNNTTIKICNLMITFTYNENFAAFKSVDNCYYYTYKTYDPVNGEYYYGQHKSHKYPGEDGYHGSWCEWVPEDTSRLICEILSCYDTREDLSNAEKNLILAHWKIDEKCKNASAPRPKYTENGTNGGGFPCISSDHVWFTNGTTEIRVHKDHIQALTAANPTFTEGRLEKTNEHMRKTLSDTMKAQYASGERKPSRGMRGKTHDDAARKTISDKRKAYYAEVKPRKVNDGTVERCIPESELAEFLENNPTFKRGRLPYPEKAKEKISATLKKYFETNENAFKGKTHTKEAREKMSKKLLAKWQDPEFGRNKKPENDAHNTDND